MKIFRRKKKGFTLIELMIVIAIIAILAAILIVQWTGARKAAYDSEGLTIARNIVLAMQVWYAQNGLKYTPASGVDLLAELGKIEPSITAFHADPRGNINIGTVTDTTFSIVVQALNGTKDYTATQTGVTESVVR